MNATKWILLAIGVVIVLGLLGMVSFYNSMVSMDESLRSMDAQVQNMYERRTDLVPQVAATVKRYMEYEGDTLKWVVALREASKNFETLQSLSKEGKTSTPEYSNLLASTMSAIRVTIEAYPQLKADNQFTNLFTTLEGSENRIRVEIKNYNDAVATYNLQLRSFPYGKLFSGMLGFSEKSRITPPEGKDIKSVPNVDALLETK